MGKQRKENNENKRNEAQDIIYTREYNYLETKDFKYLNLEYIKIFGQRININKVKEMLIETIELLLYTKKVSIEDLKNIKSLRVSTDYTNIRSPYKLNNSEYYISTGFGYGFMITIIEKILNIAGAKEDDLVIKFK